MLDYIIVGSGPSGGRFAYEFCEAGAKVLMLEAGRRYSAKDFPLSDFVGSSKLFWGGGVELSQDASLGFLRAKVVGGTSIVNQALLDEFDDDAWSDWKSRSGINDFSVATYREHYEALNRNLKIETIEDRYFNRNTKLFVEAFNKKGYGYSPLHRGQSNCDLENGNDCMACLGGCPRNSKQSSLVTTIAAAEKKGLQVESEFEVHSIDDSGGQVTVRGVQRGVQKEFKAKKVVLAAGSFGTTHILLKSGFKSELPALGTKVTAHPQFMSYAFFNEHIDAHKGAFQGVKSYDTKIRKMGLKLENVFAPPIGTSMLFAGMGKAHLAKMKKYRNLASMEVAIRDEAVGELKIDKAGKLIVKKSLTSLDWKKVHDGLALVRELFGAVGVHDIEACMQVFGLHLMGGCSAGVDGKTSVVGPDFKVHGHRNVIIADSSVFPSAPGINPSFTIMALSHRAAQKEIKEGK